MSPIPPAITPCLLQLTVAAAAAEPEQFQQQVQLLRTAAGYDTKTRTWRAYIGQLDARALDILQRLYDAASRFGTEVQIEVAEVHAAWQGASFTDAGSLAALLPSRPEQVRALGQLPTR